MVLVRALQTCFVGNCLREAGSTFEHDGPINDRVLMTLDGEKPVKQPEATKAKPKAKPKAKKLPELDKE